MEKERIVSMLTSPDWEMACLGAATALRMGEDWCLENLPKYGHICPKAKKLYPDKFKDDIPPIKIKYWSHKMFICGDIGILMSEGFLHCRPLHLFNANYRSRYHIIDFNHIQNVST